MGRTTLEHTSTSKQIKRVLALSKKERTRGATINFDAQEVVKSAKVLNRELGA
jgi:hypothetical protein